MEERLFLRRIREEFPDVTCTSHRYLTHGWDHAVLILDEALAFRAPKAQAYRDALPKEVRLLRYLRPRVDVGIPDYVFESADGSFAGYRLLAGRELDAVTFGRLSETEKNGSRNSSQRFSARCTKLRSRSPATAARPSRTRGRTTRTSFATSRRWRIRASPRAKSTSSARYWPSWPPK